jgi:hypothetical protein
MPAGRSEVSSGIFFSDYFGVTPEVLDEYGAFNISIASDLPLFVDPFLIFNSERPEYVELHHGMIDYVRFLRDKAIDGVSPSLLRAWYEFNEVKQNWLGFTVLGNEGAGLGKKFANALYHSLRGRMRNFGDETLTRGSHLEKVTLIRSGVGRANISDFTVNLIKHYLLGYTQQFARQYLAPELCGTFSVAKTRFNYTTTSWQTESFYLPRLASDFVLLTPIDLLTRDDTWINHRDMIRSFERITPAMNDATLRAQVEFYLQSQLGDHPTDARLRAAIERTYDRYPELIDLYIRTREDEGDDARIVSLAKTESIRAELVDLLRQLTHELQTKTDFYRQDWTSYDECMQRVLAFKRYIEDQDGYRILNSGSSRPSKEPEVQIFFGLLWCLTDFDVNREPNNGRGPVDFKVSYGSHDKSLIEFKLASNSGLKRNLERQVEIYEAANQTRQSIKVIICYSAEDQRRVERILTELKLIDNQSVVIIDARHDNKPSASKA